jgi:hypothetical protein
MKGKEIPFDRSGLNHRYGRQFWTQMEWPVKRNELMEMDRSWDISAV